MRNYIHGARARAACSLLDELKARGISGQVGYEIGRRYAGTLTVFTDDSAGSLPLAWVGFRVYVEPATGPGDPNPDEVRP